MNFNSLTTNASLLLLLIIASCMICIFSVSMSLMSGWSRLTDRFRADREPSSTVRSVGPWFFTARMRWWTRYRGMLRMQAADDGLYLSVWFPYRVGHPRLRIPWEEIRAARLKRLFRDTVMLELGRDEQIPMHISLRAAHILRLDLRFSNLSNGPFPSNETSRGSFS